MKRFQELLGIGMLTYFQCIYYYISNAADPYSESGSETGIVSVQDDSGHNPVWISYIDSGIAAWNRSETDVDISVSSSSSSTIKAARYDVATIFSNFAKGTVAHEFGHVFWLCDNPSTAEPSLMKYSNDFNTV